MTDHPYQFTLAYRLKGCHELHRAFERANGRARIVLNRTLRLLSVPRMTGGYSEAFDLVKGRKGKRSTLREP